MSKGHGGKREGAGRPQGSGNLADIEQRRSIAELARTYSDEAIAVLAGIMREAESDAAKVSAAQAILDRAYGKPVQANEILIPDAPIVPSLKTEALVKFLFDHGATESDIKNFIDDTDNQESTPSTGMC